MPTLSAEGQSKEVYNNGTFPVQVDSLVPGTGASSLAKAEDAAHASGDVGVQMLAVRTDAPGSRSGADGDYEPLQVSAGRLWASAIVTDLVPGTGASSLGKAEDAAHASADVGVMLLGVRTDSPAARSGTDGDYEPLQLVNGALTASGLRQVGSAVTLLASAARTASASEADVTNALLAGARSLLLVCDVTAQSGVAPTLDVAIQAKFGSRFTNLARFSQYAGATGAKAINVKRDLSFATEITLAADPSVSSGLLVNNHDWSDTLRIKYDIGGTTPSFTFSVVAYPIR